MGYYNGKKVLTVVDVRGGGSVLTEKSITQNGVYNASSDNADGYSKVTVNVSGGTVNLQRKTVTPTTSQQQVTPDSGYDGLSKVTVNRIPSEYIIPSGSLNITANGTYDVTEKASVNANVPSSGGGKFGVLVDRSITTVTAEDLAGVTQIGHYTFAYCRSLASINIPNSVTYIDGYAFYYCDALTSVTIPDTVTNINNYAFNYAGLTSVTIGSGINRIGVSAFNRCSNLASVTITKTTPPTLASTNAFSNTDENLIIYVPAASVTAYKTASNWSSFASRIQAIPT